MMAKIMKKCTIYGAIKKSADTFETSKNTAQVHVED